MRCDEAIRQISQPTPDRHRTRPHHHPRPRRRRREGRGIGLLSKVRACNFQNVGHDTVTAGILLGHGAGEHRYGIAGVILRDLGFGEGANGKAIRLLTNDPDKVKALEEEGLRWSNGSQWCSRHGPFISNNMIR